MRQATWFLLLVMVVWSGYGQNYTPLIRPNLAWDIMIFPNPTNSFIRFTFENSGLAYLTMLDLSGRIVLESIISGGSEKIDVSALETGTYICRITTKWQSFVGKVHVTN